MKFLIVLLSVLTLAACSSSEDSKKSDAGTPENVTDYSICGTATPPGTTIENRNWHILQRSGDLSFDMVMRVSNGYMQMSNYCSMNGTTLAAHATARATVFNGTLQILNAAEKTEEIDQNGVKMNCNISISQGTVNYGFKGQCLEISQPGSAEKVLMAPY